MVFVHQQIADAQALGRLAVERREVLPLRRIIPDEDFVGEIGVGGGMGGALAGQVGHQTGAVGIVARDEYGQDHGLLFGVSHCER